MTPRLSEKGDIDQNASNKMQYSLQRPRCIVYYANMLFEIGQKIRQERKKRGLSQAALAERLGMSRTTIGQIELGTVGEVGVRKLIRLLEVLELELRVRPAGLPPTLDELREEEERP